MKEIEMNIFYCRLVQERDETSETSCPAYKNFAEAKSKEFSFLHFILSAASFVALAGCHDADDDTENAGSHLERAS